jgi:hypothetical protein
LRAVEDDHVDRPGMEAQQCVEFTGTNSSIGLIVLINQCSSRIAPKSCRLFGQGDAERKRHL